MGGIDEEESEIVRREAARHGLTETQYRMMKVAPTDLVQSIVWDHVGKSDVLNPRSIGATPEQRAEHSGTGWVEPRPLEKQPGIDLIDQMVENQSARERIAAVEERRRAALEAMAYEEKIKKRDQELDPVNAGKERKD